MISRAANRAALAAVPVHENPGKLKSMAEDRVRHMIAMDPVLNIFVGSFQVEVRP